jgi:hypothetical protein
VCAAGKEPSPSLRELLRDKALHRPLIISIVLMYTQQLSGINAVFYYSTEFFKVSHVWLCVVPLAVARSHACSSVGRRTPAFRTLTWAHVSWGPSTSWQLVRACVVVGVGVCCGLWREFSTVAAQASLCISWRRLGDGS